MPPAQPPHVHVAEVYSVTRFPARVVCRVSQHRRHADPAFSCRLSTTIAVDIAAHAAQRVFGYDEALA